MIRSLVLHTVPADDRMVSMPKPNWNGHPALRSGRLRRTVKRANKRGLYVTATTNGVHATNSYHYQRRAVDVAGTFAEMCAFQRAEYARAKRMGFWRYKELLGPINSLCILNGRPTTIAEGSDLETMHDNHVHVAR